MLGFIAAVLFAIAFIINAANVSVSTAIFSVTSLMLLGLVCLSLHLIGVGAGWKWRR
jgi:putative Mn2+ efflux pump MntP